MSKPKKQSSNPGEITGFKNVKLADIKPYWRNPRDNEAGVEAVKDSLQTFGYTVPIIVDAENVIIAGHTRYLALRALCGIEDELEVLVRADLAPDLVKEFRIIDNAANQLSAWKQEKMLEEMQTSGSSADFRLYFPKLDLPTLLKEAVAPLPPATVVTAPAQAPEPPETIDLTCPHCSTTFPLEKRVIASLPSYQAPAEATA